MLLRVTGDYRSGAVAYTKGQLVQVTDEEGAFLMRDSPGSFAPAMEQAVSGVPAVDRQMRGGKAR